MSRKRILIITDSVTNPDIIKNGRSWSNILAKIYRHISIDIINRGDKDSFDSWSDKMTPESILPIVFSREEGKNTEKRTDESFVLSIIFLGLVYPVHFGTRQLEPILSLSAYREYLTSLISHLHSVNPGRKGKVKIMIY